MSSRNAVDVILNRNLDRQNAANSMNACNVANLSCSLGTSLVQDARGLGVTGKPHGPDEEGVLSVDDVIYGGHTKKKGGGSDILHSTHHGGTGKGGKRPANKSNRAALIRFMKQQADIINDLDE
jgi:hypothetical protein